MPVLYLKSNFCHPEASEGSVSAQIKNLSADEIEKIITENAKRLFKV